MVCSEDDTKKIPISFAPRLRLASALDIGIFLCLFTPLHTHASYVFRLLRYVCLPCLTSLYARRSLASVPDIGIFFVSVYAAAYTCILRFSSSPICLFTLSDFFICKTQLSLRSGHRDFFRVCLRRCIHMHLTFFVFSDMFVYPVSILPVPGNLLFSGLCGGFLQRSSLLFLRCF